MSSSLETTIRQLIRDNGLTAVLAACTCPLIDEERLLEEEGDEQSADALHDVVTSLTRIALEYESLAE